MRTGVIAFGFVLLSGCADPKATAFKEALDCWEASELLAISAPHGTDAQLLGVENETADEWRRHWNTETLRLGEKIGKSEVQVNQELWALFSREAQQIRNEIESSPGKGLNELVERNKVCMKRIQTR